MKRLLLLLLLAGAAWCQITPATTIIFTSTTPGSCSSTFAPMQYYVSAQTLYGCNGTAYVAITGSSSSGSGWTYNSVANTITAASGATVTMGTTVPGSALSNPSAPTITQGGTAGSTNYSYVVVAYGINGYVNYTAASSAGSTSTGPSTLNGTNYNIVTTAAVTGSSTCAVYRTVGGTKQGKIGYVTCGSALNDVGLTADSTTAPSSNTTANSISYGNTFASLGNSYGYGVQETIGQKLRRLSARAYTSNPLLNPWLVVPPAWQSGTTYVIGTMVTNGGNVYLSANNGGTSAGSGGPSGTGAGPITDNTVTWYYYGVTPSVSGVAPSIGYTSSAPSGLTNVYHSASLIANNFTQNAGVWALYGNSGSYCGYMSYLLGSGVGCGVNIISFMSDAPKVSIAIYSGGGTSVAFIVDDQYVQGPGNIGTTVGYPEYITLDYTSSGTGSRARKYVVEMQGGNTSFYGVAIGPQYSVWPVSLTGDRIRAVFDGDSLTGGGGGFPVMPDGDWAGTASKLLGWSDPWNIAQGSTGYCTAGSYQTLAARIQNVTSVNPDLVIIAAGADDLGAGYTASQITACATPYFEALRAALPATPIIVMGIWPQATGPNTARTNGENAVASAVTAAGGAANLIYFVPETTDPAGAWQTGTGNVSSQSGTGQSDIYTSPDGAHITEAGIQYLGRRAANGIRNVIQIIP